MGAVQDSLAGKTPRERAEIKARAINDRLATLAERTFTRGEYAVVINSAQVIIVKDAWLLDLNVTATRNGLPLPIDGHLRFYNPPILVPDGTFRTLTAPDGKTYQKANYTENLREALRGMVIEAIRRQVR